jgi:putative hydrolase
MGTKRLRAVRESLAGRLGRVEPAPADRGFAPSSVPADASIGELLAVDDEYRRLAKQGQLPRIAPRRFNPTREAWLPVLHTQRGERHYTALYSNTMRAHEMGTTRDWVVIYRDDPTGDGHWTVITATYGRLAGRRVVCGLESECSAHYGLDAPRPVKTNPTPLFDQLELEESSDPPARDGDR